MYGGLTTRALQRREHMPSAVVGFSVCIILAATVFSSSVSAREPYFRVYGNDVTVGGGYGGGCSADPDPLDANPIDVITYGDYAVAGTENHSTYVGAGSELAVFAPGTINQFLPGAVDPIGPVDVRSALWELSYANTDAAKKLPGTQGASDFLFGGGYNSPYAPFCPDPFPTSGFTGNINGNPPAGLDVSTLCGGVYQRTNVIPLKIYGVLPDGCRVMIVANNPAGADFIISDNITYQNSSWANTNLIPLLQVYANGDIYIDKSVTTVTGVFQAGGDSGLDGKIYTCSDDDNEITVASAADNGVAELVADCGSQPLTVYGSLTAREVVWNRINGDVVGASAGEGYTSLNLAETIVFSPEIYLALLAGSTTSSITTSSVDALRALPPAF